MSRRKMRDVRKLLDKFRESLLYVKYVFRIYERVIVVDSDSRVSKAISSINFSRCLFHNRLSARSPIRERASERGWKFDLRNLLTENPRAEQLETPRRKFIAVIEWSINVKLENSK